MEATHHLTLSGRYGVYGDRQLIRTELPEELQNYGDGVRAWAHPALVPVFLGSSAGTEPPAKYAFRRRTTSATNPRSFGGDLSETATDDAVL